MRIRKVEPSVGILGKIVNLFSNSKQDTYSCDYINKFEPAFAQIFTNQKPVIPSGSSTLDLEGVWGSSFDTAVGKFNCDAPRARIKIPAGSAEYIEVFGAVAGALQPMVSLELHDENGNYAGWKLTYLSTFGGYKTVPIGSQIFKIPDNSKNYYVVCSISNYVKEDTTLNDGFGVTSTYFGVRKLK